MTRENQIKTSIETIHPSIGADSAACTCQGQFDTGPESFDDLQSGVPKINIADSVIITVNLSENINLLKAEFFVCSEFCPWDVSLEERSKFEEFRGRNL